MIIQATIPRINGYPDLRLLSVGELAVAIEDSIRELGYLSEAPIPESSLNAVFSNVAPDVRMQAPTLIRRMIYERCLVDGLARGVGQ